MAVINFELNGFISGIDNEIANPTSLQFGPDGRLYVSEQNGTINAFTVELQNGEYSVTDNEVLTLSTGDEVVKSILNHNDFGVPDDTFTNRQVTGFLVVGTAANPILYISSSDPRIAQKGEKELDTNSGIVTQVTWTGTDWEAVDLIRGLPRSEENHSTNGLVLSPDGTKLYLAVGGNTNNGAPSEFFSYTAEYALSGTVLEIDLEDINSRPILTDPAGGQNGASRQYIYDLPTLDDPSVANDGVREDSDGLDVAGPFGGNDGFNQAILPADAPLRIFADGFRNHYDLVISEDGNLYTVDNGSNGGLGGNPLDANGNPTNQAGAGEPTNTPNGAGKGDGEPLFLIEDGGYYGHPNPVRSDQDLEWVVYNNDGDPDLSVTPNSFPNVSDLVPGSVNIQNGFVIDPSKFTGDATRLSQSGIRVERGDDPQTLAELGSSSNGLVEYTADAFDGALQNTLLVTQFNGSVRLLNLNEEGTAVEDLIDPGDDGVLGTADDEVISEGGNQFGTFPLLNGFGLPLDVTTGPDGSIWVADIETNDISVFTPSAEGPGPVDLDFDDDGILNVNDPFIRDASNGGLFLTPGETLLFDFSSQANSTQPGPGGYGGGLTGVMIDGATDFEQFFQDSSTLPEQQVKLDNVKFNTAAGGGATVIESVSNGDPFTSSNSAEYLFHTGVTISPTVETFTAKWSVFNPASEFIGPFQQIGGYIGTGDQSNYLKLVAIQSPNGEIQILLEDNDVVQASSFIQADDLFDVPPDQRILLELEVDPTAATATPTITYETGDEATTTVSGNALDLSGTAVLDAILGSNTINGQNSGLAVGLFSSNNGQPAADTFQAVFDDIEITATGDPPVLEEVLYRVNAGGPEIAAIDGGLAWSADTSGSNSAFLADPGSNNTTSFPAVEPGPTVLATTPGAIFDSERWDQPSGSEMQWAFDVPTEGTYNVRLYLGNGFGGTSNPGERIFDVAIEGSVLSTIDNIDLSSQFGNLVGGQINNTVEVTDGTLNLEFIHDVENPLINGIEIVQMDDSPSTTPAVSIIGGPYTVGENDGQVQISLLTNLTVPSNETVEVTFEITPGTATAQEDYEYLSATATFDPQTGTYTDTVTIAGSSSDATFLIDILQDTIAEADEAFTVNITDVSPNADIGTSSASVTIEDDDGTTGSETILYRVNAGGPEIAAIDGGLAWSADTSGNNSSFLADPGSNSTASFPAVEPGPTVLATTPGAIFDSERWDQPSGSEMQWAFDVPTEGTYNVRLYLGNGFGGTSNPGERIFDVAIEGSVLSTIDNIDLSSQFGNLVGGQINNTVEVTDGTLNLEFIHDVQNPLINGIEIVQVDDGPPSPVTNGEATLAVTANNDNVQISNFGSNSFEITNTGDKQIAQVDIDVTNALYPDSVFDPFGLAGDLVSKELSIDTNGSTGVVAPSNASYIGAGGTAGFEGLQLLFDASVDGGFETGETIGFSVDMDPNSIAGAQKNILDSGTNPPWDVGGVSGAELIGSNFTVTFADGTTAKGQLQGAGNQGGSQSLASQDAPDLAVDLIVNGLSAGGVGTYDDNGPTVFINGPAGQTARIVLTKGFIQPETNEFFNSSDPDDQNYAPVLQAQLDALAASDFPANNAVEFQTVDVQLTGANQDISELFDVSGITDFDFAGEDQVPLGFVASVIDPTNDNLPLSPVTAPIYLEFADQSSSTAPTLTTATSVTVAENQTAVLDVNATDADGDIEGNGLAYNLSGGTDQGAFAINVDTGVLSFANAPDFETPGDSNGDNAYEVEVNVTDSEGLTDTQLLDITVSDVDETSGGTPIRLEAENADSIANYRTENIGVASGGQALTFLGGSANEEGSATFGFDETPGAYNIIVGTFDENDGVAQFVVELEDAETGTITEIGTLELDASLGSNLANAQTFISPTVATGVNLTSGDQLIVNGFENGNEHARLDYIELVPVI